MVSSSESESRRSHLLSTLPPPVISLLLPHLDLPSLLALEQTCRLLRSVVSQSGEYARRCRRLGLLGSRKEANSEHCKLRLINSSSRQPPAIISDHRVSQNLCFTRSAPHSPLSSLLSPQYQK